MHLPIAGELSVDEWAPLVPGEEGSSPRIIFDAKSLYQRGREAGSSESPDKVVRPSMDLDDGLATPAEREASSFDGLSTAVS